MEKYSTVRRPEIEYFVRPGSPTTVASGGRGAGTAPPPVGKE
jgi:hypothetical protein